MSNIFRTPDFAGHIGSREMMRILLLVAAPGLYLPLGPKQWPVRVRIAAQSEFPPVAHHGGFVLPKLHCVCPWGFTAGQWGLPDWGGGQRNHLNKINAQKLQGI